MRIIARQRLGASAFAVVFGLAVYGVASAQSGGSADPGILTGEVARCVNGAEQPAAQVAVGVDGGNNALTRTDSNGVFLLALPPGTYTVIATAADGTASRQYVPVENGQSLDIGTLDIGGSVSGCGPDSDITAPVLPTFTAVPATPVPTLAPTVVPTTVPTPVPSETPVPEQMAPPDQQTEPGAGG